jgi:hypothetical protein
MVMANTTPILVRKLKKTKVGKAIVSTTTVMTQQEREETRLVRVTNMLDDMCFSKVVADGNKIKAADLLLKCLSAYKEIHEVHMVEPLVIYGDDGKKLMTLTAQQKESK